MWVGQCLDGLSSLEWDDLFCRVGLLCSLKRFVTSNWPT